MSPATDPPRNVVLVSLESVRADHCGYAGYDRDTTPNLDRMARAGVGFQHAVTAGGSTPASMTAVHTGEYPLTDPKDTDPGSWRAELRPKRTVASALSGAGYRTGAFVPNAFVSSYFGFGEGFDDYRDFLPEEARVRMAGSKTGTDTSLGAQVRTLAGNARQVFEGQTPFHKRKCWEEYYDDVLEWVERDDDRPFFLWVFPEETHTPYIPPAARRDLPTTASYLLRNASFLKKLWVDQRSSFSLTDRQRDRLIAQYDDLLRYVDGLLGRLLDDLAEYDPVFVVHGDHGDGFGEHGFYEHPQSLYEELIHVPLVVHDPADREGPASRNGTDVPPDSETGESTPVSLRSLPATIETVAGVERTFEGPSVFEAEDPYVVAKVTEGDHRKVAARGTRWKYLSQERTEGELYDLRSDPTEQVDRSGEYPELTAELDRIVGRHRNADRERLLVRSHLDDLEGV
ncbi:sulfatase [Salinirubellus sp. GCM10025818]|uniref:sulfatase n=1 Tax=Salinirubellus TaxID=2162630 RepID=UPI0030CF96AB